jgi:hypothetical protein
MNNKTSLSVLAITISLVFSIIWLEQFYLQKASATIIHDNMTNTDLDTSKPLPAQINVLLIAHKQSSSSSTQNYTAYINDLDTRFQSMASSCSNVGGLALAEGITHKPLQSMCNSGIALIYEFCQAEEFRKDAVICSDPEINDYLKTHNITDINAYAIYGLKQFAFRSVASNNSTSSNKNNNQNNNQTQLNTRINNVVNFCLKSLPNGTSACDSQLGPVLTRICNNVQQPLTACHDGKVVQYYKIRNNEIAKRSR